MRIRVFRTKPRLFMLLLLLAPSPVRAQQRRPGLIGSSVSLGARLMAQNALFERLYAADSGLRADGTLLDPSIHLDDLSIDKTMRDHRRDVKFLAQLEAIPTTGFPQQDRFSHDILDRELKDRLQSFALRVYEMPVSQTSGPHLSLADLPRSSTFHTAKDYGDYITLLGQIPNAFRQTIAVLRQGERDGLMPPSVLLQQIPAQCQGTIEEDPFLEPAKHFPVTIPDADQQRLRSRIEAVVSEKVLPAYRDFATFITSEYLPKGRSSIGLSGLPDGARRYRFAIRQHTTTDMTAAEIHTLGLQEVDRIDGLLEAVAAKAGYPNLAAFRLALRSNPTYTPQSAQQIVDTFRHYALQMQPRLGELFLPYAINPLVVEEVPASQPNNGTHYIPGSADGTRPGRVVVLTSNYSKRSLISLETQAYHEGIPGHHLQFSVQQKIEALPKFRHDIDYAAYAEGWAVYAEALGKEIGFFQEPASDYGRLNLELMRAVRLVVDTGINAEGWTREQAVGYFRESGAADEPTIQSEVDLYIARPGRNLAYQIGKLKLLELRRRAEEKLGSAFDLRTFHDQVLNTGNLPLDLLEVKINDWLASTSASSTSPDTRVSTILAKYEEWRGGAAFQSATSLHATGKLSTGGLKGTTEVWSDASGRARQDVDLGPVKQQTVVVQDHGWSNNLNGQIDKVSAAEAADAAHDGELLFDSFLRGRNGGTVTLQPALKINCSHADVLRVTFGTSTYDFQIANDGRLVAVQAKLNGHITTTSFDDWRTIRGVRFPFTERVAGNTPSDSSELMYATVELNSPVAADVFSELHSTRPSLFSGAVKSSGWLPFEFFGGTRIFIPAAINGVATTVMLDSGASSTVVDRAYAASVGLKPEGEMTAQGTGGASTLSVLNGVSLKLGALSLSNQTMVAIDLAPVQEKLGHQLPVILGNEIFHDAIVDIDFPNHRISFSDPSSFAIPGGAQSVATTMQDSIHILNITVEGKPALLQFDLGNASPLNLFPRFWQPKEFLDHRPTSTTLSGGLGGSHVQQIAMVKSIDVAGSVLTDIPTTLEANQQEAARSGRLDGNLGMPVFSRFHLLVDFPHDRILFAPPVDIDTPFQINHSGLILEPTAAGLKVLYVAPDSPGALAGLKAGDIIVAENGADMIQRKDTSLPTGTWRYGPIGETCRLRLSDGRDISLVLAKYF